MKFAKVIPHEPWSKEKTQERIDLVMEDIRELNKHIEHLRNQISKHKGEIVTQSKRLSNKQKYINQLKKQLLEGDSNVY